MDADFIIEIDNPYVLAYYHINNFKHQKPRLKRLLDKAHKITYLSSTAKNHTLSLLGDNYAEKSFVNYPYMANNYEKNNRSKDVINFIFIGLNARLKGGDELLAAFSKIKHSNIRLTFISNVSKEIKKKYQHDSRIKILPPQPREALLIPMQSPRLLKIIIMVNYYPIQYYNQPLLIINT